jgi:hypothetical protein
MPEVRNKRYLRSKKPRDAKDIHSISTEYSVRQKFVAQAAGKGMTESMEGMVRKSRIGSSLLKVIDTTGC